MYAASITGYDRAGRINSGLSIVAPRIIPGSFANIGRSGSGRCVFSGETSGSNIQSGSEICPRGPGRISGSDPGRNFLQSRGPQRRLYSLVYFLFLSFSHSALASLKLKVPRCSRVESLRKTRSLARLLSLLLHHDAMATSAPHGYFVAVFKTKSTSLSQTSAARKRARTQRGGNLHLGFQCREKFFVARRKAFRKVQNVSWCRLFYLFSIIIAIQTL